MQSPAPRVDAASLALTWELLGEARVGAGAVAWIRVTKTADELVDAVTTTGLRFEETGEVPSVLARNDGGSRVLLLAQSVLSGGLQTRAVDRSVVLGPGARAVLPVHCIEQGRWEPRAEGDSTRFAVDERTSVRTRFTTSRIMVESLRARGAFRAEQSAVWRHVDEELVRTRVVSTTRSYEAFLEGVQRARVDRAREADVAVPEGANGALVVFPRSDEAWLEVFPTSAWLARQRDALLADLFEEGAALEHAPDMRALLDEIFAQPATEVGAIPATEGTARALAGDRVRGSALFVDDRLAHLAVARGAPFQSGPVSRRFSDLGPASVAEERMRRSAPVAASQSGVLPRSEGNRTNAAMIKDAFARLEGRGEPIPRVPQVITGYRLVRATSEAVAWIDVELDAPGFAILGAHDRCDLVLPGDATVWLRHLIAICVPTPAGPALRIIDLRTSTPFFLEDDQPRTSVLVTGTFGLRLGAHVVCGFPVGKGEVAANGSAPVPVPVQAIEGDRSIPSIERVRGPNPYRIAPRSPTITPVPAPSEIQDLLAAPRDGGPVYAIALESRGRGASLELPLSTFESGVLIGRATNCYDAGLRSILCDAVSRAHLLLLRVGDRVAAFDVGSTNGTRSEGKKIRRMDLADAGTTLELAKKVMFRWRRLR